MDDHRHEPSPVQASAAVRRARPQSKRPLVPGVPVDPGQLVPRLLLGSATLLARYHQHRVHHLDRLGRLIRAGRRVVLVGNHVLDVVDPLLFVAEIVRRYGCAPHFIGHENIIFHVPGLRELASGWGAIPSRHPAEAGEALARDGLLMLYPGSGTEAALRRYRDEPYRLKWEGRLGYLRLALEHDAELVFVAAIGAEEMYYQSSLATPDWVMAFFNAGDAARYHGTPLGFGLLGPHLVPGVLPLPVQITHHVSPPIDLGERAAALRDATALEALHRRVWRYCQAFLDTAVARRDTDAPLLDRLVRGGERLLQRLGV
jgi:1-acyl-sn-glycerol-3-phosphate acyltransferase